MNEFLSQEKRSASCCTWNTIAGQPTDDSEMALLLARMLVGKEAYDPKAALKDPEYEEHESFMEWSGGDYDSERFDANAVNWELMKYLRWSRDRYQNWGGVE